MTMWNFWIVSLKMVMQNKLMPHQKRAICGTYPTTGCIIPESQRKWLWKRVVFDCSAKFEGKSLNEHLLTGPDLTYALTGLLCRFRECYVAITCDVEKMFHRFHVTFEDRDFLRFLWWKNWNIEREPKEYRVQVHVLWAASSPGCANYGMKYLACKYEKD